MFRPTMFMGMLVLAVLAFAVFQVEHRVHGLRNEYESINKQLVSDREAIHVLKAEWTYLNQPKRLKEMAAKYTDLSRIDAHQVRDIGDIPLRDSVISSHDYQPIALSAVFEK